MDDEDDEIEQIHMSDNDMVSITQKNAEGKRKRADDEEGNESNKKKSKTDSMKEDPLIVDIRPGRSTEMSEQATEAFNVLNMAMISYFCAFDSGFEEIQGCLLYTSPSPRDA